MSSGTDCALTRPVAAPGLMPEPVGGSASITLPEISVGPDPGMGGGALPGDGSARLAAEVLRLSDRRSIPLGVCAVEVD